MFRARSKPSTRARKIASVETGIALSDIAQVIPPRVERNIFAAIEDTDFELNPARAPRNTER